MLHAVLISHLKNYKVEVSEKGENFQDMEWMILKE